MRRSKRKDKYSKKASVTDKEAKRKMGEKILQELRKRVNDIKMSRENGFPVYEDLTDNESDPSTPPPVKRPRIQRKNCSKKRAVTQHVKLAHFHINRPVGRSAAGEKSKKFKAVDITRRAVLNEVLGGEIDSTCLHPVQAAIEKHQESLGFSKEVPEDSYNQVRMTMTRRTGRMMGNDLAGDIARRMLTLQAASHRPPQRQQIGMELRQAPAPAAVNRPSYLDSLSDISDEELPDEFPAEESKGGGDDDNKSLALSQALSSSADGEKEESPLSPNDSALRILRLNRFLGMGDVADTHCAATPPSPDSGLAALGSGHRPGWHLGAQSPDCSDQSVSYVQQWIWSMQERDRRLRALAKDGILLRRRDSNSASSFPGLTICESLEDDVEHRALSDDDSGVQRSWSPQKPSLGTPSPKKFSPHKWC